MSPLLLQSSQWLCSILVPSTHTEQNAHRIWVLSQKTTMETRPGRKLVVTQPKKSSENPSQGKGRGGRCEVTPFTPPAATQQGHAHALAEILPGSRLSLWSETTLLKGEDADAPLPIATEPEQHWPQRGCPGLTALARCPAEPPTRQRSHLHWGCLLSLHLPQESPHHGAGHSPRRRRRKAAARHHASPMGNSSAWVLSQRGGGRLS